MPSRLRLELAALACSAPYPLDRMARAGWRASLRVERLTDSLFRRVGPLLDAVLDSLPRKITR